MKSSTCEQARRPRRGILIAVVLAAILISAMIGTLWWQRGEALWSDGAGIHIALRDARVRDVLWSPPHALELPSEQSEPAAEDQFYEPSLSPDGNDLYFVRGKPATGAKVFICHRKVGGRWTTPISVEAVNGSGFDVLGPRVTADGKFLLFSSNRPGGLGGYDIWAAPRLESDSESGWGAPFNLGAPVNSEFNEYNPDPTPDGRQLIFSTDRRAASEQQVQAWRGTIRESATADFDLWIAAIDPAATPVTSLPALPSTQPAKSLSFLVATAIPGINSPHTEGASCMSPAGDFLYFASNRPGGYGKFDLYRSRVSRGAIGPPENLGPTINSGANETDPALALQGFRLCFSSDRSNDGGFYDLFASDSREVFIDWQPRELPRLGRSIGSLLLSTMLLLPLILLLQGTRNRRLSMLQRCMILSLVVHAAAAFLFSFVIVTQEVTRYARRESPGSVNLNLSVSRDVEIGLAARAQFSAGAGEMREDESASAAIPASERLAAVPRNTETDVPPPDSSRSDMGQAMKERVPIIASANPVPRATLRATGDDRDATKSVGPLAEAAVGDISLTASAPVSQSEPVVQAAAAKFESGKSATDAGSLKDMSALEKAINGIATAPSRPAGSTRGSLAAPAAPGHQTSADRAVNRVPLPALNVAALEVGLPQGVRQAGRLRLSKELDPLGVASDVAMSTPRPLFNTSVSSGGGGGGPPELLAAWTAPPAISASTRPIATAAGSRRDTRPNTSATTTPMIGAVPAPIAPEIAAMAPTLAPLAATNPSAAKTADDASASYSIRPATRLAAPSLSTVHSEVSMLSTQSKPADAVQPRAITAAPLAPRASLRPPPSSSGLAPGLISPSGSLSPGAITAAESPFPRSEQQRQTELARNGGTDASEKAVDQGLAYLSRVQQSDGSWTYTLEEPAVLSRVSHAHDPACTGLALLALLARDHAPNKDGRYRGTVNKGLEYLLAIQDDNGDLRGPPGLRGPGSNRGNMYDQAIAALALAEAALMSRDRRYSEAAIRGALFIVAAQDPQSGGWRYSPGEYGDSSVFGWQIMALHAAEQLGLEIPELTRLHALRYLQQCGQGDHSMLAGYQPGQGPTATMTAELLYSRMLLGQKVSNDGLAEAADFISHQAAGAANPDPYCWYYGSLCLLQVHGDAWNVWNRRTRDTLIRLQHDDDGPLAGSWDTRLRWGAQGGRVFTTSLAVLTLEVYYRYLPVQREGP